MTILSISFDAVFGSEVKKVELSSHSGGMGGWFVMINGLYNGTLFNRNGHWVGFFNNNNFTGADILEMGDRIENHFK